MGLAPCCSRARHPLTPRGRSKARHAVGERDGTGSRGPGGWSLEKPPGYNCTTRGAAKVVEGASPGPRNVKPHPSQSWDGAGTLLLINSSTKDGHLPGQLRQAHRRAHRVLLGRAGGEGLEVVQADVHLFARLRLAGALIDGAQGGAVIEQELRGVAQLRGSAAVGLRQALELGQADVVVTGAPA